MRELLTYLGNYLLWVRGFGPFLRRAARNPTSGRAWIVLILYQGLDVLVNTSAGGDPRTSLSLDVARDRRNNPLARAVNSLANFLFHPDGPPEIPYGEGHPDDREIHGPLRVLAIAWTLGWVGYLIYLFVRFVCSFF